MIGLPNPYLIIGAIVTAIALYFFGHHKGWVQRDMEMQVEIAKKNEEARQTEIKLTEQVNETATKLSEANNVITKKQTDLNALIRAGRVRLPATGCVQAAPNPTIAARDRNETGSEPDRQVDTAIDTTLEAIAAIIAQGDRNTEQLNACIDAYNNLRTQLNAQR
jgi:hypothetical protein